MLPDLVLVGPMTLLLQIPVKEHSNPRILPS
jgi:hypothetical protein